MDTTESSVPYAHPSPEDHDDTVEAHYSGLERLRPHACIGGWVFIGYIDECGEERSLLRLPPLCRKPIVPVRKSGDDTP